MTSNQTVQAFYNTNPEMEWKRIEGRPEFYITKAFLKRTIKPGASVLDIGGGTGRYSLWLSEMGCDVTLVDLSEANVQFALHKANELNLPLRAFQADALDLHEVLSNQTFDHVLLMGPLYHLLSESDRHQAIKEALTHLNDDGYLYASFITLFAGIIYDMIFEPQLLLDDQEKRYVDAVRHSTSYAGAAFTDAYFIDQDDIKPLMEQFNLKTVTLFGQESFLSPCESNIMNQPKEIVDAWLKLAEIYAEKESFLSWSEHIMYIGQKRPE